MTDVPGFDPDHNYYDEDGEPITLLEWGTLFENMKARTHGFDPVTLPGGIAAKLKTVYLGFVDPYIDDARLFGTALLIDGTNSITQIEVHDSKADALRRHQEHLKAIEAGHHCACCRDELEHNG